MKSAALLLGAETLVEMNRFRLRRFAGSCCLLEKIHAAFIQGDSRVEDLRLLGAMLGVVTHADKLNSLFCWDRFRSKDSLGHYLDDLKSLAPQIYENYISASEGKINRRKWLLETLTHLMDTPSSAVVA